MRFYHYTPREIRDAMDERGRFRTARNLKELLAQLHPRVVSGRERVHRHGLREASPAGAAEPRDEPPVA